MKTWILISIYLLSFSFSLANTDFNYKSTKKGITIIFRGPASSIYDYKQILDSLLSKVVSSLKQENQNLKILVLVNPRQLSFPNGEFKNFISVAFDTLREIDNDFIFNYYSFKEDSAMELHGGLNTFKSRLEPIDINSTLSNESNKIGIKIIYDRDYRLGEPIWSEIEQLINYSVRNAESIKENQKRDTVRYNTNGWFVSLLSIDTFAINQIFGRSPDIKSKSIHTNDSLHPKHTFSSKTHNSSTIVLYILSIFALLFLIIRRKHIS